MFVARVKNNPANYPIQIDGANLILARVDAWKLCRAQSNAIALDTPFALAVPTFADLEDLMIFTKLSF